MTKKIFAVALVSSCFFATSCNKAANQDGATSKEDARDSIAIIDEPKLEETEENTDFNAWPWDFPQAISNEAQVGDYALSCFTFYPNALEKKKDLLNETLIYYSEKITAVENETITMSHFGDDVKMPNALVIPIPAGQKAKKGDIVLTWWQSGSGLQRAIVTDASNPEEPKVCYLDLGWEEDGSGFAQKHKDEQLKPNTFKVLSDKWEAGAQIVAKTDNYKCGTIVALTEDKVLVLGFADKLKVYNRADCVLIPAKESINKGDKVYAEWVGSFKEGYKVLSVDKANGRVKVQQDGSNSEYKSIYEVTKAIK